MRHSQRKRRDPTRLNLRSMAPVLDPTKRSLEVDNRAKIVSDGYEAANSEQVLFSVDCHSYPALILLRAGFADHGDSNHMQVAVFLFAGCLLHLSFFCRF